MPLNVKTLSRLRGIVEQSCENPPQEIPRPSVVVISKDGEELFAHVAGKRGLTSQENMSLDSAFWIASCTKILVGLACMQHIEKGMLRLDERTQVEQLCPELKQLKVLRPDVKGLGTDPSLPALPGEGWEYGPGIDWDGVALERATGLKLNNYL
ncbi:beta-lactamase family [Fusarium beomiforme]|uniref:Beta-lactamase family n=1 Tax=Fusarium beomiforme TaxID=44412 RepID=A0A9P5AQI8_9HYPO|nr:beta-lactamase family [Fusarium beomiforme]